MADLSQFPITERWPAADSDVIQLYSFPTANGVKVSIALEEMGIAYEPHRVTLSDVDVRGPEFRSLNPNNKIPAIIDPNGPDGTPIGLFESGAILIYLAEKSGRFLGATQTERYEILKWLMFQMGGLGPMVGQMGFFFKLAGKDIQDPRPRDRYLNEGKRLLYVIEGSLDGRDWIAGEYSIADMAIAPWLRQLEAYGLRDLVGWTNHPNAVAYLDRFLARPAVQAGLNVPPREA